LTSLLCRINYTLLAGDQSINRSNCAADPPSARSQMVQQPAWLLPRWAAGRRLDYAQASYSPVITRSSSESDHMKIGQVQSRLGNAGERYRVVRIHRDDSIAAPITMRNTQERLCLRKY
jgi:hypothetical protein